MTLTWPWALLGLLAIPALVVAHRRLLRAQARRRSELAAQGLVLSGQRRDRWRQVAPALLLAALAVLVVALSRPVAAIAQPNREGTVVLAFDVSGSMAADDVRPTRLDAAKAAARGFVERQPASVRIGVVAFGGTALVTARPTDDRDAVLRAINRLQPQGDTSLGQGILGSLSAIAGRPVTAPGDAETSTDETPIGYYGGTAVVLLTDGEDMGGPDPAELADLASSAGVRIETVGLGTPQGTVIEVDGFSIATALDAATLRQIAETTGGTYHAATDAASLASVYDSIQVQWVTRTVPREITSLVAGLAALLLLAGASVSVLRQGRVI
jgi:Ca-activated chloride channel homolog